jgi:hypothetical protein
MGSMPRKPPLTRPPLVPPRPIPARSWQEQLREATDAAAIELCAQGFAAIDEGARKLKQAIIRGVRP